MDEDHIERIRRACIRAFIRQRPDELRSRHVISNVFIDVLSGESGWLFRSRRLYLAFRDPRQF